MSYQRCDRCHKRKDKDAFREHAGQCRSCDEDERVEYEAAEERARRHAEWTEALIAAWRAAPAEQRSALLELMHNSAHHYRASSPFRTGPLAPVIRKAMALLRALER